MCDHVVKFGDLRANSLPPLRARSVEDSRRSLEGESELVGDLDERQPTQLLRSVHAPPGSPDRRTHQSAFVVVPQRRRTEPQLTRRLADRNQIHPVI